MGEGRIEEAARFRSVVVFAGAGVSSGAPTSLPGWKPLNAAIFRVLRERLENGSGRDGWLAAIETSVDSARNADRFPPDYQAQVMEEMCGERYFQGLQALDVSIANATHEGIAALAAAGAVRAVVTTNFDRLIERTLEQYGVAYDAAIDPDGFRQIRQKSEKGMDGPLPVVKIHGCVGDALSMIDTLKQRRKGRSRAIEECLEGFASGYWLYLGFSAADLETDRDYLGLLKLASHSGGATYVRHPSPYGMSIGAETLMGAYGEAGEVVVAEAGDYLAKLLKNGTHGAVDTSHSGREQFDNQLRKWAEDLSLAATGLCLAAMTEAAGESNSAAHILDRLVRKERFEQDTPDFHHLQLQYGRLGAALGRYINVPDLNGLPSNASVEAIQSLLRLVDTKYASRAMGYMPCLYLWLDKGEEAMALTAEIFHGFISNEWVRISPQTDEEAVDAWLSAAQVCLVNKHSRTVKWIVHTSEEVMKRAKRSGDVVRTARVIGLSLLAYAEAGDDETLALAAQYEKEMDDALRVGDGFALGFFSLALGRWHTGRGGMTLAKKVNDLPTVAKRALQHLELARIHFEKQCMDPWLIITAIQTAKAMADLRRLDEVNDVLKQVDKWVDRFPILDSHFREALGQIQLTTGHPEALINLRMAIDASERSGLHLWRDYLIDCYCVRSGEGG